MTPRRVTRGHANGRERQAAAWSCVVLVNREKRRQRDYKTTQRDRRSHCTTAKCACHGEGRDGRRESRDKDAGNAHKDGEEVHQETWHDERRRAGAHPSGAAQAVGQGKKNRKEGIGVSKRKERGLLGSPRSLQGNSSSYLFQFSGDTVFC